MADRPPPDEDDDFELELEPVDPEIVDLERKRGERKTDEAVTRATFDELYEERPQGDYEIKVDWSRLRQFRFTTQHLLIATAVLAILLTFHTQLGGCMSLFVIALAGIGAGWYAIYRKERRQANERQQRREEFLATRGTGTDSSTMPASLPMAWEPEPQRVSEFRFAFSTQQLLITVGVAAVMLGLLRFVGPETLTITLGAIAVVGLAVQTFGLFDPPPAVVLGWWMLLVLYLALGLMTAFWPKIMSQRLSPALPSSFHAAANSEC